MAAIVAIPALITAAEYVISACAGILIAVGIMDEDKDEGLTPKEPKPRPDEQNDADVETAKKRAKDRLAKIAETGELSQAKNKCKQCPANAGVPKKENANTGNINILYQVKITGNPYGPGWVQTWLFAAVSFDGFQSTNCLLQEVKGAFDQFFISDTQIKNIGVVQ